MNRTMLLRSLLIMAGIVGVVLGVAFYFRWSGVEDFWPWSGGAYNRGDLTPLSYYFLSSIFMAIAIPNLWMGITGEFAAVTGGAIDLAITYLGAGIYMVQSSDASSNDRLLNLGLLCLLISGLMLVLALWTWRIPFRDPRPLPSLLRVVFGLFVVTLLIAGSALVLKQNVFPWSLRDEVSVIYGWIFLGAAAYFAYGILVPKWHNACGQLLGFLAYDLILILPFIRHFSDVQPEHRLSLVIYTTVVSLSGILAIYYLFVHPPTRLWGSATPIAPLMVKDQGN